MLLDGEAILGLTGAPMWAKGLHVHATFHEAVRPIVSAHHPLAQRQDEHGGKLSVTDLYDHTIYRISLSPNVTALVENIAEAARSGSGGAVIQIPATMGISLLIQGQGVAFLPENAVRKHIDDGRLVYLNITDIPPLVDEILLVSLKGRALDVPAKEFVRLLREVWRSMLVD
jgi:DNA-binding transcriptional LysR family regulator